MSLQLRSVEQLLNSEAVSVAASQTNTVVSNPFEIDSESSMLFSCQVHASAVTGTAGIVKIQHSLDGTNWTDVDATNAKVTLTAAGYYPLSLNGYGSTMSPKMPLFRNCRFVVTTTSADTCTIASIQVQVRR